MAQEKIIIWSINDYLVVGLSLFTTVCKTCLLKYSWKKAILPFKIWTRNVNQPFLYTHIFVTYLQSIKTVLLHHRLHHWSLSPVKLAFQNTEWTISKRWLIFNFHCKTLFLPCCKQISSIWHSSFQSYIFNNFRRAPLSWNLL